MNSMELFNMFVRSGVDTAEIAEMDSATIERQVAEMRSTSPDDLPYTDERVSGPPESLPQSPATSAGSVAVNVRFDSGSAVMVNSIQLNWKGANMDTTRTLVVCSKCGRYAEYHEALNAGWLIASRVGHPGHMIIRCPAHITAYARAQAGLPQQHRTKRVADNLERGLYVEIEYVGRCIATGENGVYVLTYYDYDDEAVIKSETFSTIDQLIAAMRRVEPDLRKWRVVK